MGVIRIDVEGSFKPRVGKMFSAMKHGHAAAVSEAIAWLSGEVLPAAIAQDHELHAEQQFPEARFGKDA